MDALLCLLLEAHHPERNHHRFYEIRIGQDLFGDWTVITRFGRVGQQGQERSFSSPTVLLPQQHLRELLQYRLSAPKRIGCRYQLVNLSIDDKQRCHDWIAADLLRHF